MHGFGRTALLVTGILLVVTLPTRAEDQETAGEDPWKGKTRAEIVELLGQPQKLKKAGRDGETLTYKLFRLDPSLLSRSDMRMLPVPGVGVVGQVDKSGLGTDTTRSIGIGPSEFDEYGRPTGAGSESVSMSYDPETGITRSGANNPPPAGKVKLRFVLDADGRIKDWSVSGKK